LTHTLSRGGGKDDDIHDTILRFSMASVSLLDSSTPPPDNLWFCSYMIQFRELVGLFLHVHRCSSAILQLCPVRACRLVTISMYHALQACAVLSWCIIRCQSQREHTWQPRLWNGATTLEVSYVSSERSCFFLAGPEEFVTYPAIKRRGYKSQHNICSAPFLF